MLFLKCQVKLLATDVQLCAEADIAIVIFPRQISQQLLAAVDQRQQTGLGAVVLAVALQVFGQVYDAGGKKRDLYFRAAGIAIFAGELGNGFCFGSHAHSVHSFHFFHLFVSRQQLKNRLDKSVSDTTGSVFTETHCI